MVSDNTTAAFSNSLTTAGTTRWMSPELVDPDQFGLKGTLQTKKSDCYALGMVIYEVLSGHVPFVTYGAVAVIQKVTRGERPERPQGGEGAWFADYLWDTLQLCWAHRPEGRPTIEAVLECLELVSQARISLPPSPDSDADDLPQAAVDLMVYHSASFSRIGIEELPTGVLAPCCMDGQLCYEFSCPRRVSTIQNPGHATVYSNNFYCVIRENLRQVCQCLWVKHQFQERYVPRGCTLTLVECRILFIPSEHWMARRGSPGNLRITSRK